MARIVIALYDQLEEARDAVDALIRNGYTHADISLVANDARGEYGKYLNGQDDSPAQGAASGASLGAVVGGLGGLLAGLGVLAIPGIGPVLAAGPLVAALAGAGIGAAAGGLIGGLVDLGIPENQAERYAEGVRRGGTLLTVRTSDELADETVSILNRFNPVDINRRAEEWQAEKVSALNDIRPEGDQPMNLETESSVALDEARREMDRQTQEPGGDIDDMQPGLHRLEEGGAVVGEVMSGQVSYPPDEHAGEITMQDAERESARAEAGAPDSSPRAGYGESTGFQTRGGEVEEQGFEAYEPLFRQHYSKTYSHLGDSYDDLRPAYAYGYGLASDPRYRDRRWSEIETSARDEWENAHPDQPWEEFKAAVREAWLAVTGQR